MLASFNKIHRFHPTDALFGRRFSIGCGTYEPGGVDGINRFEVFG